MHRRVRLVIDATSIDIHNSVQYRCIGMSAGLPDYTTIGATEDSDGGGESNIRDRDSDGDGLYDGMEAGGYWHEFARLTDADDNDGDGSIDELDECFIWFYNTASDQCYHTDPGIWDTDGDSAKDGVDVFPTRDFQLVVTLRSFESLRDTIDLPLGSNECDPKFTFTAEGAGGGSFFVAFTDVAVITFTGEYHDLDIPDTMTSLYGGKYAKITVQAVDIDDGGSEPLDIDGESNDAGHTDTDQNAFTFVVDLISCEVLSQSSLDNRGVRDINGNFIAVDNPIGFGEGATIVADGSDDTPPWLPEPYDVVLEFSVSLI